MKAFKHYSPLLLSLSLFLSACPEQNTNQPDTPSAESTATASPEATDAPVPEPTGSPTPETRPSATPDSTPTPSAEPAPSATASATPEASTTPDATPTSEPTAISDISVVETTTFNGAVFDDTQSPLDDVNVSARSLNSAVEWSEQTQTVGGTYVFNNAPSGVQIEITASKEGFSTRSRVEVLKSNKEGDPSANRYDFGNNGVETRFSKDYLSLSERPEVVGISPARNATGVSPGTSFTLSFNKPMETKTVEDTFSIRAFTSAQLSVDSTNSRAGETTLVDGDGQNVQIANSNTLLGVGDIDAINGTQIWNKEAFEFSWNSDETEVTFTFKDEIQLPTDKESPRTPDYQIAFKSFDGGDRTITDQSGKSRSEKHFKLTSGDYEDSIKFSIASDETRPELVNVAAQTDENKGNKGDAIFVTYSERMILYAQDKAIAGGMDTANGGSYMRAAGAYPGAVGLSSASPEGTARNYRVKITRGASGSFIKFDGNWSDLGGTAIYNSADVTHKSVLLVPPVFEGFTVANVPAAGDELAFRFIYTDGTTSPEMFINVGGSGNTVAHYNTDLNNTANFVDANDTAIDGAALGANLFTVAELTNGGATVNTLEATDVLNVSIAEGVLFNSTALGGSKAVAAVEFTGSAGASGNSAGTQLGLANNILVAGAVNVLNEAKDIYEVGDSIQVTVASTILDPAGNQLDTQELSKSVIAN